MNQIDIVNQTSRFLANSIKSQIIIPVYAPKEIEWKDKKGALSSLLHSVNNIERPNTMILGNDVEFGKSMLNKLLVMLNEREFENQKSVVIYSLKMNKIQQFPSHQRKRFIMETINELGKVQETLELRGVHARLVLHFEGKNQLIIDGDDMKQCFMTSKIAIVGEMERSKFDVSVFRDRKFWEQWNISELKTVIGNPDEIVKKSSELLRGFFDDKTITPIHKRDGVDWKSRAKELEQLANFIVMPENPISVILGVAGSGKTTLLEMLSSLSANSEARNSSSFRGVNQFFVYSLKLSAIQKLDNYQEYINRIIDEFSVAEEALQRYDKKARLILFIDELHQLTFSMKTGSRTGGDALKEKLTTSPIAIIGATTRIEFDHAFSNDQAFRERWNVMELPQLSKERIVEVLRVRWKVFVEKVWKNKGFELQDLPSVPELNDDVIDELLLRNSLYRPEMGEPRKSLRVLEGLAVSWVNTGKDIGREDVLMIFDKWFGIDTEFDVPEIIKNVNRRLKGQENAKRELKEALYYAKLQSKNTPYRPVMKLLYAGSTGVGKTECVKAIAEVYGKSADAYKQFNMPDFSGDKGEKEFRQLLGEYAEHNPNGIILLDEGEKAKNVFNAMLAILEEGLVNYTIEDSGVFIYREVSLRNNIVIMTTNAGAESLRAKAKFQDRTIMEKLKDVETKEMYNRSTTASQGKDLKKELLNAGFTPELYNRFDRVVLFENLDNSTLLEIGDSVVEGILETVQKSFGVEVALKEEKEYWRGSNVKSYDISALVLLTRMDETDTDMGGARGMIKQVGNLISDYLIPYIFEKEIVYTGKRVEIGVGKTSRLYVDNVDEFRDEMVITTLEEA